MERAHNAALHDRPEPFDGVGVNRPDDVLALGVVNKRVRKLGPELGVTDPAVGAEQGDLMGDRFANECGQRGAGNVIDYPSNHVALADHRAGNDGLVTAMATTPAALASATRAAPLVLVLVLDLASDQGLVDFHDADKLLELSVTKGNSDLGAHQVRSVVGAEAHDPEDLKGANTFLREQHHVHDAEPVTQGLVGVLEDGADQDREAVAALRALGALPMMLFGGKFVDVSVIAAGAADSFRPTVLLQVGAAC